MSQNRTLLALIIGFAIGGVVTLVLGVSYERAFSSFVSLSIGAASFWFAIKS